MGLYYLNEKDKCFNMRPIEDAFSPTSQQKIARVMPPETDAQKEARKLATERLMRNWYG